jgi:hypothetical protein
MKPTPRTTGTCSPWHSPLSPAKPPNQRVRVQFPGAWIDLQRSTPAAGSWACCWPGWRTAGRRGWCLPERAPCRRPGGARRTMSRTPSTTAVSRRSLPPGPSCRATPELEAFARSNPNQLLGLSHHSGLWSHPDGTGAADECQCGHAAFAAGHRRTSSTTTAPAG